MKGLILFICFSSCLCACKLTSPQSPKIQAGQYSDFLEIAFHPESKELSASFNFPEDSCKIYLVGKLLEPKANLISWEIRKRGKKVFGILEARGEDELSIRFETDLLPCHLAAGFKANETRVFSLIEPKPWIRIQSVKRKQTTLFKLADIRSDSLTSLNRYQVLRTLKEHKDWLEVSLQNQPDSLSGWVKANHLIRFPG